MSVGRRFLCVVIVAACALIWENMSARAIAQEAKAAQNGDVQDLLYLSPKRPIVIRLHIRVDGQPLTEMRARPSRGRFSTRSTRTVTEFWKGVNWPAFHRPNC